jgi:hypothetical protein
MVGTLYNQQKYHGILALLNGVMKIFCSLSLLLLRADGQFRQAITPSSRRNYLAGVFLTIGDNTFNH